MARSTPSEFNCPICNKPIDLQTCKTNGAGNAVHEECYVLREALKNANPPNPASDHLHLEK
jgi:hypothetical protein